MNINIYLYINEDNQQGIHGYGYLEDVVGKTVGAPIGYSIMREGYVLNSTKPNEQEKVNPLFYLDGFYTKENNHLGDFLKIILKQYQEDNSITVFTNNNDLIRNEEGLEVSMELVPIINLSFGLKKAKAIVSMGETIKDIRIIESPNKQYWKPSIVKHPILDRGKLYFQGADVIKDKFLYRLIKYDKENEPGSRSPIATYVVMMTNKPIERVEEVKQLMEQGSLETIHKIDLANLYNGNKEREYTLLHSDRYLKDDRTLSLDTGEIVCSEIKSPGLVSVALSNSILLQTILYDYINDVEKSHRVFIDISDYFFFKDRRGKQRIKPEITNEVKKIEIDFEHRNKKIIKIPLIIGSDTLNRNVIKKIELTGRIILVVSDLNSKALTFRTITVFDYEGEKDYIICSNYYCSRVIIK